MTFKLERLLYIQRNIGTGSGDYCKTDEWDRCRVHW